MQKYRARDKVVEAKRWWRLGDHPEVDYFRYLNKKSLCKGCGQELHRHGTADIGGNNRIVCPGNYIVKDASGELHQYLPEVFEKLYEEIEKE